MPLVQIDLLAGKPSSYRQGIGDAVQRAMVEQLDVPLRDQFQLVSEHDAEHFVYNARYLDVERTDNLVMIRITLSEGRSRQQKQAFYARLVEILQEQIGIRPQDVLITLIENTREDWSFGNGQAQYLTLPKEQWR